MSTCHAHHRTLVAIHFCERCSVLLCDICKKRCLENNHGVKRVPKHKILGYAMLRCISLIPKKCRTEWMRKKIESHEKTCKLSDNVQDHIRLNNICKCDRGSCRAIETKMGCETVPNDSGWVCLLLSLKHDTVGVGYCDYLGNRPKNSHKVILCHKAIILL